MNLQELLLQFEGERGHLLEAEDAITDLRDFEVMTSSNNKIVVLVKDKTNLEENITKLRKRFENKILSISDISYEETGDNFYVIIEFEED